MFRQKKTMGWFEIRLFFGIFVRRKTVGCKWVKMGAKENAYPLKTVFYPIFKVNITPLLRQQKTALFKKCRYYVVFRT